MSTLIHTYQEGGSSSGLSEQFSRLTEQLADSSEFFPSPLSPVLADDRHISVPRFAYFGRGIHEESPRLALFAGLDASDIRSTELLVSFMESLTHEEGPGHGLHLSFFPLVDVVGYLNSTPRNLGGLTWVNAEAPELRTISNEIQNNGYHGFILLSTSEDAEVVSASVQLSDVGGAIPVGVELLSSDEFEPWEVLWESASTGETGPLSLASDLARNPFEVRITLPARWSFAEQADASSSILSRFLHRHAADQAFAQHL